MVNTRWLTLPILIALVILPRLSIDLYLPALPRMALSFHASDVSLKMTLTIFMFGYALSMIIAGPLSDIIGRKRVMFYGLIIYILSTFICAISPSILTLTIARFFQAIGGCCGTVVARVMVRDSYCREEQIKILTYLSAAMAICPLLTPILGGALQTYFGWRAVFYLLVAFSLFMFIINATQLTETHKTIGKLSLRDLIGNYKTLLQNRLFMGYSLAIGFAWCCYFVFTLESPFIIEKSLGLTTLSFGFIFSLVVFGYLIGTLLAKQLANRVGWDRLILIATCLCVMGASFTSLLVWFLPLSWISITIPMMVIMTGVGIIIPCTQAAVMQPFPTIAGTASGLFFFIQMIMGGTSGLIVQMFKGDPATAMARMMLVCSILLFISFYTLIWNNHVRGRAEIAYTTP